MNLELLSRRETYTNRTTVSRFFVEGTPFGYVLEDVDRGLFPGMPLDVVKACKVAGHTAIPTGRYEIVQSMSAKYGKLMPLLLDVPGFNFIRLHPGNYHTNTEGCLLVGEGTTQDMVTNSVKAFTRLHEEYMIPTWDRGGRIWIDIQRST